MRLNAVLLCLITLAGSAVAGAQETPLLVSVTDVWRSPLAGARVYSGAAVRPGAEPLAESGEDGRCTISVAAGTMVTVEHSSFAPLVVPIEQSDLERGYITAILYLGGAVQANFRVGGEPMRSDYVLLRYADPAIYGGVFQAESSRNGNVRFSNVPEGLAYVTGGARVGEALRTATVPVQVENESSSYAQLAISAGNAAIRGRVISPDGTPTAAALSGTFIFDRRIEELHAETDEAGAFELTRLPGAALVLRARANGLLKRVDFPLEADAQIDRDIRFDEGATVRVDIDGAPEFTWIDVFILESTITPDRIRDLTDRATYLRSARNARLRSKDTVVAVPGVPPGDYAVVALATRVENDRRITSVSQFEPVSVRDEDVDARVEFPASE